MQRVQEKCDFLFETKEIMTKFLHGKIWNEEAFTYHMGAWITNNNLWPVFSFASDNMQDTKSLDHKTLSGN